MIMTHQTPGKFPFNQEVICTEQMRTKCAHWLLLLLLGRIAGLHDKHKSPRWIENWIQRSAQVTMTHWSPPLVTTPWPLSPDSLPLLFSTPQKAIFTWQVFMVINIWQVFLLTGEGPDQARFVQLSVTYSLQMVTHPHRHPHTRTAIYCGWNPSTESDSCPTHVNSNVSHLQCKLQYYALLLFLDQPI